MSEEIYYEDTLPGGCHWSLQMQKGLSLRFIDKEGGANVGLLLYNPNNLLERYNAPDTLKCQHTFKLTRGNCLYSDMGRVFCSIVEDSAGWHDTVCGNLTRQALIERWGERSFQEYRNDWCRSGCDAFLVEIAKYGLGKRDLAANLNLFSKVSVDDTGNLQFDSSIAAIDRFIELRFEMDTLVIFHTCPHPLNPAKSYPKKPVTFQIRHSAAVTENDPCRNLCPENQRGLQNSALYTLGLR
ncbi:MAG: urea carboxylase-associated family protein [Halioglobus sp.]|nr:urea carboxylase-associated family protein [Halioglobus sp.]